MKGKNSQCLTQASPSETTKLVSGKLFNRQLAGQCDGSQNWLHPPHTHLQLIYLFPIFFPTVYFFLPIAKKSFPHDKFHGCLWKPKLLYKVVLNQKRTLHKIR